MLTIKIITTGSYILCEVCFPIWVCYLVSYTVYTRTRTMLMSLISPSKPALPFPPSSPHLVLPPPTKTPVLRRVPLPCAAFAAAAALAASSSAFAFAAASRASRA